jgi:hypothetical protein
MKQTMEPAPACHDLDSLPLVPMPPKIRESYDAMRSNPHLFDDLDLGEEGVRVALHGGEIAASGPDLSKVLQMVDGYGQDEIIMLHVPPDDVIEIH